MLKPSKMKQSAPMNGLPPGQRPLKWKASPGAVVLSCALLGGLLVGTGWAGFWFGKLPAPAAPRTPAARSGSHAEPDRFAGYDLEPGPWGRLHCQPIVLQIPAECLAALPPRKQTSPVWWFKDYSPAALEALLRSSGLSDPQQRDLLNTNHWSRVPNGMVVRPSTATILSLSPEARSALYSVLALARENASQYAPCFWRTADEPSFFSAAAVPEAAKTMIHRLSYRRGNLSLLADLDLVLEQFPDRAERIEIQKFLSSQPATLVNMDITSASNIDGLIHYWGVGGLAKVAAPVLEAAAKIPQGRKTSLLAVLPEFARERLNTYARTNENNLMDDLWSAFNFFKDQPEPPTAGGSSWAGQLKADYFPVFADPRYGDILLVTRPNGEVIRAAVFLAGDLVFTRNGRSIGDPWLITSIPQMLELCAIHLADQESASLVYYRNKSFD